MFMSKVFDRYWMIVGMLSKTTCIDDCTAAAQFAAMVAAHNGDYARNERAVLAAIMSGAKDIQWNSEEDKFEY